MAGVTFDEDAEVALAKLEFVAPGSAGILRAITRSWGLKAVSRDVTISIVIEEQPLLISIGAFLATVRRRADGAAPKTDDGSAESDRTDSLDRDFDFLDLDRVGPMDDFERFVVDSNGIAAVVDTTFSLLMERTSPLAKTQLSDVLHLYEKLVATPIRTRVFLDAFAPPGGDPRRELVRELGLALEASPPWGTTPPWFRSPVLDPDGSPAAQFVYRFADADLREIWHHPSAMIERFIFFANAAEVRRVVIETATGRVIEERICDGYASLPPIGQPMSDDADWTLDEPG